MFRSQSAPQFQQSLAPLVDRALTLDGAGLSAWLKELRADCPTVTREIERILAVRHAAVRRAAAV